MDYTQELDPSSIENHTGMFLIDKKCPTNQLGFYYLKNAVTKIITNRHAVMHLNGAVYHEIAKRNGTSIPNVERCLRNLSYTWWNTNQCANLFTSRPSNKQLLITIAEHVRHTPPNNQVQKPSFIEEEHHVSIYEQLFG